MIKEESLDFNIEHREIDDEEFLETTDKKIATRNHFAKEERVIYRLAHQTLFTELLSDVGSQWAEHRAVSLE
jgi:hemerythrin-like domain-containing protein